MMMLTRLMIGVAYATLALAVLTGYAAALAPLVTSV
jgi:hypothetical protein